MRSEPVFSVVVPTHARPGPLVACLQGLVALRFPPDRSEVIISDDGSPSSLEPVVAPFRESLQLTLITQPNRGPAAARNHGAAYARGRYLVFLDDDCIPVPTWLTALEERFSAAPEALIGGGIGNALPDNPFSTATQLIVTYVYDYFERSPGRFRFFNTSNLAVPAEAFRALGGFRELPVMEDYDFARRMAWRGQVACLPGPAVTSSRRWRRMGVVRTVLAWTTIRWLYLLGVSAERLAGLYRRAR